MQQVDVERSQEFRKCIECFLCQNICHVIRDHEENKRAFAGPRFLMRVAELDMHPVDTADRREIAQDEFGLGYCNITKCCTEVCPEHIKITDNAMIPMKERVVDRKYDPLVWLGAKIRCRIRPRPAASGLTPGRLPASGDCPRVPTSPTLEAVVVGLIQGVTELFPVSSLGHNVLLPAIVGGSWATDLNVAATESPYLAFIVGLHVATAIALLVYFWRDWVRIVKGFLPRSAIVQGGADGWTRSCAWMIILATIPVGLVGLCSSTSSGCCSASRSGPRSSWSSTA